MAAKLPRCLGWLIAFVLVLALAAAPTAFAAEAPRSVTVAIGEDYPPFNAVDGQGHPWGWLVDTWRLWSSKTGIEVKFVAAPFAQTLKLVAEGKVDVHGGCFYSKQRAEYLDFAGPLCRTSSTFFFHKGLYGINTVLNLAPYRVGVIKGDFLVEFLRDKLPEAGLAEFDTYDDMFTALKAGEIRVFASDTPVGLYFLNKWNLISDYTFLPDKPLYSAEFRAAVKKGNGELAGIVAKGLDKISRAERVAIERRWSGMAQGRKKGVLLVGCERHNQPFSSLSTTGRPTGILVDIWRLWAAKTGRRIEFVFGTRSGLIDRVRNAGVDIVAGLISEPYMDSWMQLSHPLFTINTALFYRTSDGPVDPSRLAGQNVGVLKDSFLIGLLAKRHPGIIFEQIDSMAGLARTLQKGEVRAVAAVAASFNETLVHMGYSGDITWDGTPLSAERLQAGVAKDKPGLLEVVNKGLAAITRQEILAIEKRWVPDETMQHFANTGKRFVLSPAEKKWLAARKRPIVAGAEMDWPPFDFVQAGRATGYSNELLRLAAERAGLNLQFVSGFTWEELLVKFRKGEIDILPAVYETPERVREMAFTKAYAANPTVIVTRDGESHIRNLENMAGKKLAVIEGFSISRLLMEKHRHIKQVFVKNVLEGLKAVSLRKADAFVGSLGVITHILNENIIPNVRIVDEVVLDKPEATSLHMATLKSQAALCGILQKALDATPPGAKQRLKQQWLPISVGSQAATKELVLSAADKKWLAAHPHIALGIDPAWMPFEGISEEGDYQGIAAGLCEVLAKKLGVALEPAPGLTWPQVLAKARRGEVQMLPAAMRTPEREKYLLFSRPYLSFPVVVVTRDDVPVIVKLEDLKGKDIAVPRDYAVFELIKRDHPELRLKPVQDIEQGLREVSEGEVYAYVGNIASVNYHLKEMGLKKLKIAATTGYNFELSMAVRKDWPQFAAMVQRALNSMTPEEKAAITSRWINVHFAGRIDWGFIARAGGTAAAVVLIVLTVIIIWNRRMAREVAQRKETEERLAAMVANVPGAIFQMNIHRDGRREYHYLSPQAKEFFNATPEEIIANKSLLPWHPEDQARVNQEIEASISAEGYVDLEARIIPPGGEEKWVRLTASAADGGGEFLLATGFILDVTARRMAEERFKSMAANVPGTIFQFVATAGGQARFTYVNEQAEEFWGAPPEVIIAEKRLLQFHPDDKERAIGEINRSLVKQQKLNMVVRIYMPNGEIGWIRVSATPSRISDSELAYNGFILNITERKLAEHEYQAAERKVKAMSQAVGDALIMIDGEGKIMFWNPAAERLFGYSEAEALGQDYHGLTAPEEYQDKIRPGLAHFARTGEGPVLGTTTEITGRNRQGEQFPVEVTLSSFQLEGQWFAAGTVRDISERKKAEEAIRESEQRVRTILNSINTGIVIIDPENHTIFDTNPLAEEMIGVSREDIIGAKCHQFICPKAENDCPITDHKQSIDNSERILLTAEGGEIPILKTVVPIKFGEKEYLLESFVDISQRKEAEEALAQSEERSRSILDSAGEGIFGVDASGGISFINPAALHMLGFSEQEIMGQEVHDLIHHHQADGSEYPVEDCPMWASYTKGQPHHIEDEVLWRKDGSSFPVEYASTPIAKDGKVLGAVVTFRDITERKQAEEELRRNLDELERFSRLTIGREERMIALKQEINQLLETAGKDRKYKIVEQSDLQ
ncbi:MAG: transporter substrate-binding domain-containing protein [Desulfarculaceae bacterium]|nr:transporter substrate-binding domain-containing protein [Desulfarculaceae bacterium]